MVDGSSSCFDPTEGGRVDAGEADGDTDGGAADLDVIDAMGEA